MRVYRLLARSFQKCFVVWAVMNLVYSGVALAAGPSEFMRKCHKSVANAEVLLTACKARARVLDRSFYVGSGLGSPSSEHHRIWFDTSDVGSHFGLGCALGPDDKIRFFGLYYYLQSSDFGLANSARIRFVNFQGNVGLERPNGTVFTLVSIHRLTAPGQRINFQDSNCDVGSFSFDDNETITRNAVSGLYEFHKVIGDGPVMIWQCLDWKGTYPNFAGSAKLGYQGDSCTKFAYHPYLNAAKSAIISDQRNFVITEEGGLFIENDIFDKACDRAFRFALEYMSFIKEACKDH